MTAIPSAPLDPLWYKDAIIYELHVRAFADSNGDGIGDFAGLTGKLDYLSDLGVNTLWLLPFYPSPLKDDGYDIADYTRVHPDYGSLADFRSFLREAHRRGLRVITELVLNHTSDQHPWFQRARHSPPESRWRDWYVWSPSSDKYRDARVIFKDFEPSNWSWDPVAKAYYWHRFYAHQPDLNFDHPEVHKALFQVVDFWLALGVDGFRLDAIPYLYEREGTSCDNLPETHEFLRKLRSHVDARFPNRVLLAEANLWPEDAVAYFGRGDECNMAFHFPIMARMFLAVHQEDRYPMVDILSQTPAIPETAQWALFLRNHDELTLEMVTDEERDYMYRYYARERRARLNLGIRRRLAPLLQNNRKKMELLNALLFSLPGTPVIYYGDEIGMGDNIFLGDRNGVRTPMQWSGDRNAGFSRANAQRLYLPVILDPEYHYEAVNVEAQQANPQSLVWWMRRLLALSRKWKAFGRGTLELLTPENRKVLAFLRKYRDEVILVVANLSRFSEYVELELGAYSGRVPVELFGRTEFPRIGESPYLLTLGPHAFFWFAIESARDPSTAVRFQEVGPPIEVVGSWESAFLGKARGELETAFETYLPGRPWFGSRSRRPKSARISEYAVLPKSMGESAWVLVDVEHYEGEPDQYSLPVSFLAGASAERIRKETPAEVIAQVRVRSDSETFEGVLIDALVDAGFSRLVLETVTRRTQLRFPAGKLTGNPTLRLPELSVPTPPSTEPDSRIPHLTALQSPYFLTWYRRVEEGTNPDLETAQALAGGESRLPILPLGGHLEFCRKRGGSITLALLRGSRIGSTDGWSFTMDELGRYFETVRSTPGILETMAVQGSPRALTLALEPPAELQALIGHYLEHARKIGEHTAALHQYFMALPEEPLFAPEPLTQADQRTIYQRLRKKGVRILPLLRRALKDVFPHSTVDAKRSLPLEARLQQAFHTILKKRLASIRIRCHGDLSLHHFLSTGSDFVIMDWSGAPSSSFTERRLKRSPLWDVAGMVESFREAANAALWRQTTSGEVAQDRWPILESGASAWYACVSVRYLRAYLKSMEGCSFPLGAPEEVEHILRMHLLEKFLDHLGADLGSHSTPRPALKKDVKDLLELLELFIPPHAAGPDAVEWANLVRAFSVLPPAPQSAAAPVPAVSLPSHLASGMPSKPVPEPPST